MPIESIRQSLCFARQRQRLDPRDTMETLTYIAHVERLLTELDKALFLNRLQARSLQSYIEQPAAVRETR